MKRREFLEGALASSSILAISGLSCAKPGKQEVSEIKHKVKPFALEETTISELQEGMQKGRYTARSITEMYLKRIEEIDKKGPSINSVIELNPDALTIADQLDDDRKKNGPRGPMHGIPVLIKDNII